MRQRLLGAARAPLISLLLLVSLVLSGSGPARAQQRSTEPGAAAYSFGVFPALPAARLEAIFAPIGGELSRALRRDISYRSAATFEQFAARLAKQEFDIAHIQPFDYVRTAARAGYVPVAVRNDALAAIAVVRDESPIRSMGDLSGATVAMAPEFAATTYLAKVMLIRAGLAPRKDLAIKYFEDHHSCIHQAVIGTAALCFTGIQAARLYEVTTGRKLRVIARSPSIPQSLFVVHSRVSPKDRETVRETLLHTTLQGLAPELSEYLSRDPQKPFIPVQDADYDVVRQYWRMVEEGR